MNETPSIVGTLSYLPNPAFAVLRSGGQHVLLESRLGVVGESDARVAEWAIERLETLSGELTADHTSELGGDFSGPGIWLMLRRVWFDDVHSYCPRFYVDVLFDDRGWDINQVVLNIAVALSEGVATEDGFIASVAIRRRAARSGSDWFSPVQDSYYPSDRTAWSWEEEFE